MGPMDSTSLFAIVLRMRVRGRSSKSMEDGRWRIEDDVCAPADGPAARAASMSRLMMRPPGPLPAIEARLRPRSSARRLARGLDRGRPDGATAMEDGEMADGGALGAGGAGMGAATACVGAAADSGFAPPSSIFDLPSPVFGGARLGAQKSPPPPRHPPRPAPPRAPPPPRGRAACAARLRREPRVP